ncbi:MAG: hypothetical protein ACFFFG_13225 [Candidatus Thorarchaeota archaeon]
MAGIKEILYGMIGGFIGGIAMAGGVIGMDAMLGTDMDALFTDWIPRVIDNFLPGIVQTPPDDANLIIGIAAHLIIAIIYGGIFAIVFDLLGREDTFVNGLIWGIIWGIVVLILAAVGFMLLPSIVSGFPDVLTMLMNDLMMLGGMAAGHIIFGALTGVVYVILK